MGIIEGNIVSAPLNTRDVGSVLGSASNDVGTLCTHANINMWAKYKPVPLRAMFPEDTLKVLRTGTAPRNQARISLGGMATETSRHTRSQS